MRVIPLQSGSAGNCIYIESSGVSLLIDAGISGKRAKERLAACGRDIARVDALIVSHDHADHVSCAGIFHRKFGMPLYISEKTLRAARASRDQGTLREVRHFRPGDAFRIGALTVETIPTPHDGADGSAFVIDDGAVRLGIFTDLGHVFGALERALSSVDAALLESNYDPAMLEDGSYPAALKKRIRGKGGHLSNLEAAELAAAHGGRLAWLCLAHLSGENNTPALALRAHREVLGAGFSLHVADRYAAGPVLELPAPS